MENRSERPIALALTVSLLVHLLAVVAYTRWIDSEPPLAAATATPASLAVVLQGSKDSTEKSMTHSIETRESPAHPAPARSPQRKFSDPAVAGSPAHDMPPLDRIDSAPVGGRAETSDWPVRASEGLTLNPAPTLREDFRIDLATLAVQAPMDGEQQASLRAAVNHFATELPRWTDPDKPLRWHDGEREYRIVIARREPATATGLERAVLKVSTELQGLALSARVPVKRMAFSHFAQVVDRWDPAVSLAGDRIIGRLHANSELFVEAGRHSRPTVTGPVTVAGRVTGVGARALNAIFTGGIETRAERINLPRNPFPRDQWIDGGENVHRLDENAQIVFDGERGYRWYSLAEPAHSHRVKPVVSPWLIVAGEDVALRVEGRVSGSLVVYAPAGISVTGSLTYASNPRQHPDSDDFLGLVSDRDVEIAEPDVTGPGDIELFASVFAGRQFRIRRFRARNGGQLQIYGSVTAGSLTATEPRFTTLLEFDPRLENQRPAYFPLTGRYMLDGPEPAWTVEAVTAAR